MEEAVTGGEKIMFIVVAVVSVLEVVQLKLRARKLQPGNVQ